MNRSHRRIISCLLESNSPITSKGLGVLLSVSSRSVIKYVKEINEEAGETLIASSGQGYSTDKKRAYVFLNRQVEGIPQDFEQRAAYIVKRLLIDQNPKINLYDIAEDIFISYSTMQELVKRMNRVYEAFHVQFIVKSDNLYIEGSEKEKRRLISYMIQHEVAKNHLDLTVLGELFGEQQVKSVAQSIKQTYRKHGYAINNLNFTNLILHILIIATRSEPINANSLNLSWSTQKDLVFAQKMIDVVETDLDTKLSDSAKKEMMVLILSNLVFGTEDNSDFINSFATVDSLLYVHEILESIKEFYEINLDTKQFLVPFTLHINNMLYRLKNSISIVNPIAEKIRQSLPTIYDIAIHVSLLIKKHTHKLPDANETAFIALHIGAELERQSGDKEKLTAALIAQDYQGSLNWALKELQWKYAEQIVVTKILEDEVELVPEEYDIILTMVGRSKFSDAIHIIPFRPLDKDLLFQNQLEKTIKSKKTQILLDYFDMYFDDKLFYVAEETNLERDASIKRMCQTLNDLNYVDKFFYEKVMERDQAASTAFGNLAIPHSMEMDAYKTSVSVFISRDGIRWGQNLVNIVFLMAINYIDKDIFKDLYEVLVYLFADKAWIEKARQIRSFTEFKDFVISNLR